MQIIKIQVTEENLFCCIQKLILTKLLLLRENVFTNAISEND